MKGLNAIIKVAKIATVTFSVISFIFVILAAGSSDYNSLVNHTTDTRMVMILIFGAVGFFALAYLSRVVAVFAEEILDKISGE